MSRRILLLRFACQSVTRPVDARLSQRYDGGHGAAGSAAGDCVHVVAAVNSAGWQPARYNAFSFRRKFVHGDLDL